MPKFAANLSMLFNELPFLDRFDAACRAGFTGVGGREYSTELNGFWAPDDDCEAAADALAKAADLVKGGGPRLQRHLDASRLTAERWSYAAFRPMLEDVWMRLAPEARINGASFACCAARWAAISSGVVHQGSAPWSR